MLTRKGIELLVVSAMGLQGAGLRLTHGGGKIL
jgi:hypothetical protein